jgi:hypothetical protein
MNRIFLLLALIVTSLSSCRYFGGERVYGDGNIITQQRSIGTFDGIDVSGAISVQLRIEPTHSVKIEGDQNLLQYIRTEVTNGTLHIYRENGFNVKPTKDMVIYVSAPAIADIEVSGASNVVGKSPLTGDKEMQIHASGASSVELDVNVASLISDLSGACTLKLKGRAEKFSLEASGASTVECIDLVTEETTLDVSGATDVKVTSNKQLTIDATGASSVEYRGNATINQKSSGASSVKKVI